MFRLLRNLAFILIPSILVQQVFAGRPSVIYGEDDRIDYYQADSGTKGLAEGTVALIRTSGLEPDGDWTRIKTVSYGQGLGLCPDEPFFSQETAAFCSGFLVAPDTIVTAGHCVRGQDSCNSTKFVFGFRMESEGFQPRRVLSDDVYGCKTLVHSVADLGGEDFAVVKLDRRVTHIPPLVLRREGKVQTGTSLKVIGHPAGLPLKIASGASVRRLEPHYLVANLDTYGGNSGSAVFNSVTGQIEGILVRGEMDFTYRDGCRASNRCPDGGCRGEDVTLIERVLPYLNNISGHGN